MRVLLALALLLGVPAVAGAQERTTVKLIQRMWDERWVYYDAAAATDGNIDAYVLEASIRPTRPVHVAIIPKAVIGAAPPEQVLAALADAGTVVLAVDDDVYARSDDYDVEPMVADAVEAYPGDSQAVVRNVLLRIANAPEPGGTPWWLWISVPLLVAGLAASTLAIVRRRRVA